MDAIDIIDVEYVIDTRSGVNVSVMAEVPLPMTKILVDGGLYVAHDGGRCYGCVFLMNHICVISQKKPFRCKSFTNSRAIYFRKATNGTN